ncbi:hypothetical protein TNCV_3893651 [Trichonephila clavipes]|nr:hypothetical protein TNCV_3893651 [Trichonephila clavipes]
MGGFTSSEEVNVHRTVLLIVTVEQRYGCIRYGFQVDACRTTKGLNCYIGFIDSCVKMVYLSPILIEGIEDYTTTLPGRSHLGPCRRNSWHKYESCIMSSTCQSINNLESFTVRQLVDRGTTF